MNFYEFAEILKRQNPKKIVFIKTGAFFNCIGRDAIIAEKYLGLKRTCFAKGICKCGMPVQYWRMHIEKIIYVIWTIFCSDKKIINSKRYIKFSEKIDDILKYTIGWMKKI